MATSGTSHRNVLSQEFRCSEAFHDSPSSGVPKVRDRWGCPNFWRCGEGGLGWRGPPSGTWGQPHIWGVHNQIPNEKVQKNAPKRPRNIQALFSCLKLVHWPFFHSLSPTISTTISKLLFTTRRWRHSQADKGRKIKFLSSRIEIFKRE